MTIVATTLSAIEVTCVGCEACCCHLPGMLITDIGVPDYFVEIEKWGERSMARLEDAKKR